MKAGLTGLGIVLLPVVVLGGLWAARRDPAQPNWELPTQMATSPAYRSLSANRVLPRGATMQPPVEGTLARGAHAFHYAPTDADRRRAGAELTNPLYRRSDRLSGSREISRSTTAQPDATSAKDLAEGKRLFDTYCAVCHGAGGAGDGPVIPKYPNPPNFRSKQSLRLRDGELFHTITLGRKKMPSHAAQLAWDERWQVILYIRSLQKEKPK